MYIDVPQFGLQLCRLINQQADRLGVIAFDRKRFGNCEFEGFHKPREVDGFLGGLGYG